MSTEPPKVRVEITKEDYGNRVFRASIRGATQYDLSFSVGHFPEEKDPWLLDVLGRQLTELVHRTHRLAQRELQREMKKLLGVRDD